MAVNANSDGSVIVAVLTFIAGLFLTLLAWTIVASD